jgi:hypothetical protein
VTEVRTRRARAREKQPLPPPLPPERRTIGQLVAETIHLYERNLWRSLALGVGPGAVTVAAYEVGVHPALAAVAVAWAIVFGASYVGAAFIVAGRPGDRVAFLRALAVAVAVTLPAAVLMIALVPGVLWLGAFGIAVPAAVLEGLPLRKALRRGLALARVDLAHALGSVATLYLVSLLTQILLFVLLNSASDQATAISGFLASLVMSPLLFLGTALLYGDQTARAAVESDRRS